MRMTTIIAEIQELEVMMEMFDVSQPDYGEQCSDDPCDEPEILQTFGVSYAAHEPRWLDRDGMRAWVETPKQVIHLWIPEAGITSCGIGPGGEATESGDGPVTCDACLYEDAFPAGL